jgi:hypothetical protein
MNKLTYSKWIGIRDKKWKNQPISPVCEVSFVHGRCDLPTVAAYPAWGHGWMALCCKHAVKHPKAFKTDELISKGEIWQGLE